MSQQINLLNPALIRPRDWVSLKNVAMIYALAIVVMLMLYRFAQSDLEQMQEQRNAAVTKYEAAQVALITASSKKNSQMNVLEQEQALQTLKKRAEMQSKLISTFKYVQADNGHHILDYMQGFARQVMPGVWLTGFKLHAFEKNITLSGRALQADKVPPFLEHLGQAAVFKGQLFSGLKIQGVTLFDEAKATPNGTPSAPRAPAPSVNVATPATGTVNASAPSIGADAQTNTVAAPLPVVEFEVKGYEPEAGDPMPAATGQASGASNG